MDRHPWEGVDADPPSNTMEGARMADQLGCPHPFGTQRALDWLAGYSAAIKATKALMLREKLIK